MDFTIEDAQRLGRATLTRREAGALFGVDPRTVTEGIRSGNIPSVRLGKRVLIPREPLLAMLTGTPRSDVSK